MSDNTKFYISSGVGINVYDFSLFDRPSINLIRLNQKKNIKKNPLKKEDFNFF